jgi:hypothetical protein
MAASRQPETHECAPFGVHSRPRLALSAPILIPGDTASGRMGLCAVQRTPDHGIGAMARATMYFGLMNLSDAGPSMACFA